MTSAAWEKQLPSFALLVTERVLNGLIEAGVDGFEYQPHDPEED
ncbi:hypothetical protein [Pseudoglutamicibacter cumminsii]|uniref:Uncharacterized protein n=1 Tax=Pseudoglutamicibacter cumminsii TaxID=156979 RepID=A0AAP4CD15_9MICC|nr:MULTISPECIES: hypothetical protein [Pseudoglutamicibacter]MDK6275856.1 hypothetical protein [Pseudoglutamicibacter cumminsii]MDK7083411.1 hypothetical protein [Pseudoglutamicibacter cumminsii]MDZ3744998.1 hypothetical protein [Pseudoglutamicibacter cumminsii]